MAASFAISPAQAAGGPVLCLLRAATGLPCPGCGLGRSFVALAHGGVGRAFRLHPFGPLLYGAAIAAIAVRLAETAGGRRLLGPVAIRRVARAAWVVAGLWLAWALMRFGVALAG